MVPLGTRPGHLAGGLRLVVVSPPTGRLRHQSQTRVMEPTPEELDAIVNIGTLFDWAGVDTSGFRQSVIERMGASTLVREFGGYLAQEWEDFIDYLRVQKHDAACDPDGAPAPPSGVQRARLRSLRIAARKVLGLPSEALAQAPSGLGQGGPASAPPLPLRSRRRSSSPTWSMLPPRRNLPPPPRNS